MDEPGALVLFDGICNFCSGSVRFLLERTGSEVRFCAMQTQTGRTRLRALGLPLEDYETFIVLEGHHAVIKSDAILRLATRMRQPWPLLARPFALLPKTWRDRLYDLVARNRYHLFGKRQVCYLPTAQERLRFLD